MGLGPGAETMDRILRTVITALVVTMPFSVKLYFPAPDLEVITPAEVLIAVACLLSVVAVLTRSWRNRIDLRMLRDPIVLLVLGWLAVNFFAAITSTMPLVSFKAGLVKMSYIVVFFLLPVTRRVDDTRFQPWRSLKLYAWSFLGVVVFSLVNEGKIGFDRTGAGFASFPFYPDHTIYSAALTYVLFIFMGMAPDDLGRGRRSRGWISTCLFLFLLVALYLTFCRAAWVAVLAVVPVLLLVLLGAKRWMMVTIVVSAGLAASLFGPGYLRKEGASTVDSNVPHAGAVESVRSLTNITTDASNRERLNRWSCAYRMFKDRPWSGFGPGTFQFKYVDYQKPDEITFLSLTGPMDPELISSAWHHGRFVYVRGNPQLFYLSLGSAHSEYLLTLSEAGILSFLLFAGMLVSILLILFPPGQQSNYRGRCDQRTAVALGLLAYFVHAIFNNYLDDCRIAFLFWTSLALLVRSRGRTDYSPGVGAVVK